MRLIGIDPGLRRTGWGIVDCIGSRLVYVADGAIAPDPRLPLAERLVGLHGALMAVIAEHAPDGAAVEETFVSKNAASTLKLGLARGVALLVPALAGLAVAEYAANLVKKSVVGVGHAEKAQVQAMVRMLLPGARLATADSADALAVAICHAHHLSTRLAWEAASDAGVPPASLAGAAP
jgi:crossover junction endodeoxyribonuclease RuvC